jgi:sulfur carrier protein ThiS adenylyltransferase
MRKKTFDFDSVSSNYFTPAQIASIKASTIGIAGAGGLGSNCALLLVRCGFCRFVITDFDRVELSNLNRQAYTLLHTGKPKVECLKSLMLAINSSVDVIAHTDRLDAANIHAIYDCCDVIVEAFDTAECKAMLAREFFSSGKLVVSVSGLGGHGDSDRIITRRITDNFYLIGDGVSGVGGPVKPYAPCVAIAAAKQADIVLHYILSKVN